MDINKTIEEIRRLSALVIQQLGPLSKLANFGLNLDSVEWVDGYIERNRHASDLTPSVIDGLVNTLGSFLGEALLVNAGGTWAWVEQQQTIGIALPSGGYVFPFSKVRKQYANGRASGDSIAGLFKSVLSLQEKGML